MKHVIVYFHGYGSSAKTEKVALLREAFPAADVRAWDIDIDPRVAELSLNEEIVKALVEYGEEEVRLIFIGTSLGAWWAQRLGKQFHQAATILFNPSVNPAATLGRYGVPDEICSMYEHLEYSQTDVVYFDPHDPVLDHSYTMENARRWATIPRAGHRVDPDTFVSCVARELKFIG